ncbi:hypothetical protein [Halobacillus trueperi]|uniref:Uncharacterized protein n=1 Tax=Halobacillus trueperi TaxID=156205 RepID=A0A3E0J9S5_9BACI|nr:hypothetical protein [Halobacillus trueperi]REJ09683.1 hypothetical protein DYE48_08925 [Halobacillus trueperi]
MSGNGVFRGTMVLCQINLFWRGFGDLLNSLLLPALLNSKHELSIDITTPTVIVRKRKVEDFSKGFLIPLSIEQEHQLSLILIIEEKPWMT